MAARGYSKIVSYEKGNIYSFVIPLFQLIFFTENSFQVFVLGFKALFVFCLQKSKMAASYNTEIVTYKGIQIYSFVISFFCIIFHEKLKLGPILPL